MVFVVSFEHFMTFRRTVLIRWCVVGVKEQNYCLGSKSQTAIIFRSESVTGVVTHPSFIDQSPSHKHFDL